MFGTFVEQGGNLIDCAHVYADWVVVDGRQEVGRDAVTSPFPRL